MATEPIDQLEAEVAEIQEGQEIFLEHKRDTTKDFKDLTRYLLDKEWRNIAIGLDKSINETEQEILNSGRGDTELKHSAHDVLFRRCDLYTQVHDLAKSDKAEAFREYLVKEINAMSSQIIYKVVDGMGNSLDTPIYSISDMRRHDLRAFLRLKECLKNLIDTLDPQKKATKDTMNPYDKDYTNKVDGE